MLLGPLVGGPSYDAGGFALPFVVAAAGVVLGAGLFSPRSISVPAPGMRLVAGIEVGDPSTSRAWVTRVR